MPINLLTPNFLRPLVIPQPGELRMTQHPAARPLGELDLSNQLGLHPHIVRHILSVHAFAPVPSTSRRKVCERTLRCRQRLQSPEQVQLAPSLHAWLSVIGARLPFVSFALFAIREIRAVTAMQSSQPLLAEMWVEQRIWQPRLLLVQSEDAERQMNPPAPGVLRKKELEHTRFSKFRLGRQRKGSVARARR